MYMHVAKTTIDIYIYIYICIYTLSIFCLEAFCSLRNPKLPPELRTDQPAPKIGDVPPRGGRLEEQQGSGHPAPKPDGSAPYKRCWVSLSLSLTSTPTGVRRSAWRPLPKARLPSVRHVAWRFPPEELEPSKRLRVDGFLNPPPETNPGLELFAEVVRVLLRLCTQLRHLCAQLRHLCVSAGKRLTQVPEVCPERAQFPVVLVGLESACLELLS